MAIYQSDAEDAPRDMVGTFEHEIRSSRATALITRHAALIVTLGYAFLAIVGMTFNFFYFAYFGINVLEYSETSDFIVAAVQSPAVVGLCILPALAVWGLVLLRRQARKAIPRYDAYATRHETKYGRTYRNAFAVLLPMLVIVYALSFTTQYAHYTSRRIIQGKGRHIRVTRTNPIASDSMPKSLIGTTSKYLFFYDSIGKASEIVPIDNVAAITVALPSTRRLK